MVYHFYGNIFIYTLGFICLTFTHLLLLSLYIYTYRIFYDTQTNKYQTTFLLSKSKSELLLAFYSRKACIRADDIKCHRTFIHLIDSISFILYRSNILTNLPVIDVYMAVTRKFHAFLCVLVKEQISIQLYAGHCDLLVKLIYILKCNEISADKGYTTTTYSNDAIYFTDQSH
jgi:hypothetical protein